MTALPCVFLGTHSPFWVRLSQRSPSHPDQRGAHTPPKHQDKVTRPVASGAPDLSPRAAPNGVEDGPPAGDQADIAGEEFSSGQF